MLLRPPTSPLFPYTTLFRSPLDSTGQGLATSQRPARCYPFPRETAMKSKPKLVAKSFKATRSEEHTSELQSLTNLVCRLLLEKKKTKKQKQTVEAIKYEYVA